MWQTGKQWVKAQTGRLGLAGVILFMAGVGVGLATGRLNLGGGGVRSIPVAVGASIWPPKSLSEFVARAGESVVNIQARTSRAQARTGSGVIISPRGEILTTSAVVAGAKVVTVTLVSQQRYLATVRGRDRKSGLALVTITRSAPLPVARLGDSNRLRVGDWVVAVGNSGGLSPTGTVGLVRATPPREDAGPTADLLQTDAPRTPETVGGPLFTLQGEVVGITTALAPAGQGFGVAVPVNGFRRLLPELRRPGVEQTVSVQVGRRASRPPQEGEASRFAARK
jgi:S1-C subfamily serine protease